MSADVVGYSRLMGMDESGTLSALKCHQRELIAPKIAEYRGRIVKTMGDGLLIEFPSVVDAVRCAVDVQRGMVDRNADIPPNTQIRFRIGVNVGDIIVDGEDIFGDGVNVAARLQGLAEPGGICASRAVRDHVLDKLSFVFKDLGPQHVKNIARAVEAYSIDIGNAVAAASGESRARTNGLPIARKRRWGAAGVVALLVTGAAYWAVRNVPQAPTSAALPPLSVAILPFSSSGSDRANAETLQRDLTTTLAAVARWQKTVHVDARNDAARNVRELSNQYGVRYAVEGDVRREADQLVANLRLLDIQTGSQIWGQRYYRPDAATTVQSSISLRKLVSAVGWAILDAETRRVAAMPIEQLNAAELVVRGDGLIAQSKTLASIQEARALYDSALRKSPDLVFALIARSDVLDWEMDIDPKADRDRIAREMDALSSRAIELDSSNPWAWRARSQALAVGKRWNEALEAIDQATRLDPYNPHLPAHKALWLNFVGRPRDALAIVDDAMGMGPSYTGFLMMVACQANLLLNQVDQAIAACEKAASREPNVLVQLFLAAGYGNRGDRERALEARDRLLRVLPGYSVAQLRAKRYSDHPEYLKLAEAYWYPGLVKAGLPER